jgi:CRISPR-associated protein Csb2
VERQGEVVSTTLVIQFVLGRYHATPWGRHVNEGQVELPPSPWRLLRSLYAVWKTRVPDLDDAVVSALLTRLAEPPCFFVPPFRLAHSRHYYPDSKHRTGTPSTDKTLDAFAIFDRQAELAIRWPFSLPPEEHKALCRLAESLPYLGRADSICEARVDNEWVMGDHFIAGPLDVGESVPVELEALTLLAPQLPLDIDALVMRPVDVRAGRLLYPPATRFVGYPRPPQQHMYRAAPRRRPQQPVTAVRFTVTEGVLPPLTEAVALTDRLHCGAVKKFNTLVRQKRTSSTLAGRDADEAPLSGHRHAHYLALPDPDNRLAELVVWAPTPLDDDELTALSQITRLWPPREGMPGPGTVEIRMSGYGDCATLLSDLVGPARTWRSLTPFIPARHPKRVWRDFVEAEVRRELTFRDLPAPLSVEVAETDWTGYLRRRPSKRFAKESTGPTVTRGAGIDITFDVPVHGPIALGYLSHFGLGLFQPRR